MLRTLWLRVADNHAAELFVRFAAWWKGEPPPPYTRWWTDAVARCEPTTPPEEDT